MEEVKKASFFAKVRFVGNTIVITIPRRIGYMLDLQKGDMLKVEIEVVKKHVK